MSSKIEDYALVGDCETAAPSLDVMAQSTGFAGHALTVLRVLLRSSAGVSTVVGWSRQLRSLHAFHDAIGTIRLFLKLILKRLMALPPWSTSCRHAGRPRSDPHDHRPSRPSRNANRVYSAV